MKKFLLICLSIFSLYACKETSNDVNNSSAAVSDSAEIANVIHGFYTWYNDTSNVIKFNFTKIKNNHLTLEPSLFELYLGKFNSSGFVSPEFIENEKTYWNSCSLKWQTEMADDGPSTGMDADKYFCAQDWDIIFWTKSPLRIKTIGTNRMSATLFGVESGNALERNFELKKENGKWFLAKIVCDMGLNTVNTSASDQATVEQLAAFYTATLPCSDCEAIEILLTLNADVARSFTLEEQYKGTSKTVNSQGTWSVTGNIVSLKKESTIAKYQATTEGLIPLNNDGTKPANSVMLKKVQGE